jgi:hypothetical protein
VKLYEVEREVRELAADERKAIRLEKTKPIADALHQWLTLQRRKVPDGSATAKAVDYSSPMEAWTFPLRVWNTSIRCSRMRSHAMAGSVDRLGDPRIPASMTATSNISPVSLSTLCSPMACSPCPVALANRKSSLARNRRRRFRSIDGTTVCVPARCKPFLRHRDAFRGVVRELLRLPAYSASEKLIWLIVARSVNDLHRSLARSQQRKTLRLEDP